MKILIVAYHFEVTAARYIADAFTRLGHDVRHIGQSARLQEAWGVPVTAGYEWKSDGDIGQYAEDWTPDFIILADTLPNTYAYQPPTRYKGVPVIYWTVDNHVRNVRRDGIVHYFLAHMHGQAQPVMRPDETYLPCAFDPIRFKPSKITWNDRQFDVAMVGVMYPRRAEYIKALNEAGFSVVYGTGMIYDEYAAAYHDARISLCMSANHDLAQRVFETSAMGCHILTDLLPDLLDPKTNAALGLSGFSTYQKDEDIVREVQRLLTVDSAECQAGTKVLQSIVWQKHKWDDRCQVVLDWFNKEYGAKMADVIIPAKDVTVLPDNSHLKSIGVKLETKDPIVAGKVVHDFFEQRVTPPPASQLPMLNLGCGKTHLPSAPPNGHEMVDAAIYEYPHWLNVDKVKGVGADCEFDLFRYPWPLGDNSYSGALLSHIVEHIPHEIKVPEPDWTALSELEFIKQFTLWRNETARWNKLQDGWIAFFAELYRVLVPGSIAHIIAPYGFSNAGITDFSHTRYLTAESFTHSMTPDSDGATFQYNNGGIHFKPVSVAYRSNSANKEAVDTVVLPDDDAATVVYKSKVFHNLLMTRVNTVFDFYVKLEVVK